MNNLKVNNDAELIAQKYLEMNKTKLSPMDVENFMWLCKSYGLNPFKKEIYAIPFGNQITIVVNYLKILEIGQAQPNYAGYDIKYYSGNSEVNYFDEFTKNLVAVVVLYQTLNGVRVPLTTTRVNLTEYKLQMKSSFAKNYFTSWVEKIALTNAFRRTYARETQGLYIADELGASKPETENNWERLGQYVKDNHIDKEVYKETMKEYMAEKKLTSAVMKDGNFDYDELVGKFNVNND